MTGLLLLVLGQPQFLWATTYNSNFAEYAEALAVDGDEPIATGFWTKRYLPGAELLTVRWYDNGFYRWSYLDLDSLSDLAHTFPFSVQTDSMGYCYVACTATDTISSYALSISMYTRNGSEVWKRAYYSSTDTLGLNHLSVGSAGNLYAAGFEGNWAASAAVLCVDDRNGVEKWRRSYAVGPVADYFLVSSPDKEGGVYLGGYDVVGMDYMYSLLARIDSSGSLLWMKVDSLRGMVMDAITLPNGDFVVGTIDTMPDSLSSIFLVRYDTLGNVVWVREDSLKSWMGLLATDSSGSIYIARPSQTNRLLLRALDSDGGELWSYEHPDVGWFPLDIVATNSGRLYVLYDDPAPELDYSVAAFDASTGALEWRSDQPAPPPIALRNLPQALLLIPSAPTQVSLYDVSGRLVKSLYVERQTKVALKPGVYFVRPSGSPALKAVVR